MRRTQDFMNAEAGSRTPATRLEKLRGKTDTRLNQVFHHFPDSGFVKRDFLRNQNLLALQRSAGNRDVVQFLEHRTPVFRRGRPITELTGGVADTKAEHEEELKIPESGGTPLPEHLQRKWGEELAADLSLVRVHTNADKLCNSLNAEGVTAGQRILLPNMNYSEHVLAHEVAHTVQDMEGRTSGLQGLGGDSDKREALEKEADRDASRLISKPNERLERNSNKVDYQHGQRPRQKRSKSLLRRGRSIAGGGVDLRRVTSEPDSVLAHMQETAARRRGYGGFGDTPANISNSGLGSVIRRVLASRQVIASGTWASRWVDDNGERRAVSAWDYRMRVSMSFAYENEEDMRRRLGTRTSSRGVSGETTAGESGSVASTAGVSGSGSASVGGHEGAPGAEAELGTSASQTETEGSTMGEKHGGTEGFSSQERYDRFSATLVVNYTIEFQPGTTWGFLSNINTSAQTFTSSVAGGEIMFDRARL